MLRKKIILGMLILASLIGITNAYTYYDIYPETEREINGLTYLCDKNANCTTTNGDNITFNGIAYSQGYNFGNGRAWFIFYNENNSGYLSQICGYSSLTNIYSQTSPIKGCFDTYAKGNGDILAAGNTPCNNRQITTGDTITWLNNEEYAGKLTSIRLAPFGSQLGICYNYNENLQSYCIMMDDGTYQGTNYNFNITTPYNFQNGVNSLTTTTSPRTSTEEQPQIPEVTTGQICPLLKFEIDMYGRNYNTGLCYRPKYIGETESTNIFELFNSYQEFETYENLYYSSCVQPYTQEYCFSKFTGHEEQLAYITYINNKEGIDKMKVYQYCHLQLNFTEEQKRGSGTCQIPDEELYATGVNEQEATPNPLEQLTNALEDAREIIVPSTGTVRDELLPEGVVSWKGLATNVDLVKSMVSLGSKIMNIFITRQVQYQDGIIPYYISSLLILIFLYRLYKK